MKRKHKEKKKRESNNTFCAAITAGERVVVQQKLINRTTGRPITTT